MEIVMHSEQRIELGREIKRHPPLAEIVADYQEGSGSADFGEVLAIVAAYVGMGVDGSFTPDELDKISDACIHALRKKRMMFIS